MSVVPWGFWVGVTIGVALSIIHVTLVISDYLRSKRKKRITIPHKEPKKVSI